MSPGVLGHVTIMKRSVLSAIVLALIGWSGWGCTFPIRQEQETVYDRLVQEALRERDAAYERLAKAMTAYCSAKHAVLEDRHTCLVHRRLEWLHLRRSHQEEPEGQLSSFAPRIGGDDLASRSLDQGRVRR